MDNDKHFVFWLSTPLLKLVGNPYLIVRPLRQAVYYRLGIKEMKEIIIKWDKTQKFPIWDEKLVKADKNFDEFLTKPQECVEKLFNISTLIKPNKISDVIWNNHLYSLYALVNELCTIVTKEAEMNFFEEMKKIPKPKLILKEGKLKSLKTHNEQYLDCGKNFSLEQGELLFYQKNKLHLPKRCKKCRENKKMMPMDKKTKKQKYSSLESATKKSSSSSECSDRIPYNPNNSDDSN